MHRGIVTVGDPVPHLPALLASAARIVFACTNPALAA
jgi:hypothetical protein